MNVSSEKPNPYQESSDEEILNDHRVRDLRKRFPTQREWKNAQFLRQWLAECDRLMPAPRALPVAERAKGGHGISGRTTPEMLEAVGESRLPMGYTPWTSGFPTEDGESDDEFWDSALGEYNRRHPKF